MDSKFLKEFENPSIKWRGKPFWSWNGELEKDEILRQVHVIKQMGFGGHYMHSRAGLITEYLGDEWFDIINAAADESQKIGLESWLYDEDRWPSGCAGGKVTVEKQYRMKSLTLIECDVDKALPADDDIALFLAYIGKDKLSLWFYTALSGMSKAQEVMSENPQKKDGNWKILRFRIEDDPCTSNCNGTTYIDTMSFAAVNRFIEITHEAYKKNCGKRIGDSIKGIFTDEPHRGHSMDNLKILDDGTRICQTAYTNDFFEEFVKRYGYDPMPIIPTLFYRENGKAIAPIKVDYLDLADNLFIERFADPINRWCEQNNMIFTGHVLHEDALTMQTAPHGSVMRFYEHMGVPGVDVLGEFNYCYWIVKQLTSTARQVGKKWLLSELYGCSGWEMDFKGHKNVGDWQALFGINSRCPHLSWYTMEGESKRDYPASILHQSPWYKDYSYIENYFARFSVATFGEPMCDVLVLNPIESIWAQTYMGWADWIFNKDPEIKKYDKYYEDMFHFLVDRQIDFDYGEEEMLTRLASVEIDGDGRPVLRVGKMVYHTAVIGGMLTIRESTLKLLKEFKDAGGSVIFAGNTPEYVNAKKSRDCKEFAAECEQVEFDGDALCDKIRQTSVNYISVKKQNGEVAKKVFAQARKNPDNSVTLTLLNTDLENGFDCLTVEFGCDNAQKLNLYELDLLTGERYDINAAKTPTVSDNIFSFDISIPVGGTRMFIITDRTADLPLRDECDTLSPNFKGNTSVISVIGKNLAYTMDETNVAPLDYCTFSFNGSTESKKAEVLKIDRQVRDLIGIERRGGEMLQPWYSKMHYQKPYGDLELKYEFYIDEIPSTDIVLAAERPEKMQYFVNGVSLSDKANGFWIDICFKKMPIPKSILKTGKNVITVKTKFARNTNIEALYLLGDFGVRCDTAKITLVKKPTAIDFGDFSKAALPFYTGNLNYIITKEDYAQAKSALDKTDGARLFLSAEKFTGALLKVKYGNSEKIIAFDPLECEITDAVKSGQDITVTLVSTRRNTFGPLHLTPKYRKSYGPQHFVSEGEEFTDDYELIESGIEHLNIIVR